jgi:translation elongation factor EF-4
MDPRCIRHFSIDYHIDDGKSTPAGRFLEVPGALPPREMEAQGAREGRTVLAVLKVTEE